MAMTLEELKSRKRDYFLARHENDELAMEPFCYCGNVLEADYYCKECDHKCMCTFIACMDPQALAMVENLVHGNSDFAKFEFSALADAPG